MARAYRLAVPALFVTAVYAVVVVIAAVVALTTGDLLALSYLTLFTRVEQGIEATLANVGALIMAGALWAWALWQVLRGPATGPSAELDRAARRLRAALYVATATVLLTSFVPSWPWWTTVPHDLASCAVMVLFRPVLGRELGPAHQAWIGDVLAIGGYGGAAVMDILDAFGLRVPLEVSWIFALAGLIWLVLVLRAQWHDNRWQRATVLYGIAALVVPMVLVLIYPLLAIAAKVYIDATAATAALMFIWLARSAHELTSPAAPRTSTGMSRSSIESGDVPEVSQ
ncbi:hypothetical protein GCM10009677_29540 [Sphaerisporangium rubeum]|uniref:Uncharacterized protein n=1 Tax=Sphaerisporangium rubeum TaxID=321317 RepID=A0A7X0IEE6_9ACTN|nr:hypothetical protein [Sphaerisporangium rubeum]MBB6473707.1 hypothetical protein [Sphaerisporangium rubeum]